MRGQMKLPHPRIVGTFWTALTLAAILTAPAGAYTQTNVPSTGGADVVSAHQFTQNPTPVVTATAAAEPPDADANPMPVSSGTRQGDDTGDTIRQRVFGTAIAGAAIAAGTLLLLWAYVTLRDPIGKYRASMRIWQQRREERRDRTRERRKQ